MFDQQSTVVKLLGERIQRKMQQKILLHQMLTCKVQWPSLSDGSNSTKNCLNAKSA